MKRHNKGAQSEKNGVLVFGCFVFYYFSLTKQKIFEETQVTQ